MSKNTIDSEAQTSNPVVRTTNWASALWIHNMLENKIWLSLFSSIMTHDQRNILGAIACMQYVLFLHVKQTWWQSYILLVFFNVVI